MRRLLIVLSLFLLIPLVIAQDDDGIPLPVALVNEEEYDILNVLLLGTATSKFESPGLTDSILIASLNLDLGTASLVHIPRDLYVYIPDYGMSKINVAYFHGELRDENRTGVELLKETILHNLGIEIDYYARVNFNGFGDIIDSVGGITITADCALQDWRLKSPELDPQVEDNWELFTLWGGRHHMDGDTALWYVRSRRTSSDLDRGRRQEDVLRALWRKIRSEGLIEQLPELWGQLDGVVDTDMELSDVVGLAPYALTIDTGGIDYFTFRINQEVRRDYTEGDGQEVLAMNPEAVAILMQQVVLPPTASQLGINRPTVAVVNASGMPAMAYVAADRLELEGFRTIVLDEPTTPRDYNHIIDYTGADKGNPIGEIQRALRVTDEGISVDPQANREYDYKVFIGGLYPTFSCTRGILPPKPLDEGGNVIADEG